MQSLKAYPNIHFGKNPSDRKSTTPLLPLRMDKIEEITVSYDILHRQSGKYNLSFDIWVTKTQDFTDPPEANIVREIMIWLAEQNEDLFRGKSNIEKVVIDGEPYRFIFGKDAPLYEGAANNFKRDFMAFVKDSPEYSGETTIHLFLEYQLEKKYILSTDYFWNVDMGNEIWHGRGETSLTAYSIRIKAGGRSQTVTLRNTMPPHGYNAYGQACPTQDQCQDAV
jgi:hypothetical protein